MKALQGIQSELKQQKQDMKTMEESIKEAIIKNMDEKFNLIENKTNMLERKIENQQRSIEFIDKQIRKKNLVFFGIEETERHYEDLLNLILDVINLKMGIVCGKLEIETVTRIGKKNIGKPRPIVVTTSTTLRKIELLRNKKTLDTFGFYIKEDYSPAVLQRRKELQEQLKQEKEAGKNVALRYDKIVRFDQHQHPTNRTNNNKRFLSESPEGAGGLAEANENRGNTKQVPKKNKSQNITSYLRPSQLNPSRATTSNEVPENQKN